MIAQTFTVLVLAAVVVSAALVPTKDEIQVVKPMENVDPNSLSCDPSGQNFLLLPHFSECDKYYMCVHGEEEEYTCPSGLIFDFEAQVCNWKWATKCFLRDPLEGSGDDTIGLFGEEAEKETAHHFNNILNCNRADSAAKQVPYKSDCQRYWKCVSGVPQVLYCSDGLFFNAGTQQCDFEANSKCIIDPVDELKGEFLVYE